MPVGIVIASMIGALLMLWIIKRKAAEPKVEFRQDTMRYITIEPDKKKRNHEAPGQTPQARQPEDIDASTAAAPERVVWGDETPERQVAAPKPVLADEGQHHLHEGLVEADEVPKSAGELPDLLVRDER